MDEDAPEFSLDSDNADVDICIELESIQTCFNLLFMVLYYILSRGFDKIVIFLPQTGCQN